MQRCDLLYFKVVALLRRLPVHQCNPFTKITVSPRRSLPQSGWSTQAVTLPIRYGGCRFTKWLVYQDNPSIKQTVSPVGYITKALSPPKKPTLCPIVNYCNSLCATSWLRQLLYSGGWSNKMVTLPRQLIYQGGHSNKPVAPPKCSHRGSRSNNTVASPRR